jgi:type II secretory pathway pseudopilin PulG
MKTKNNEGGFSYIDVMIGVVILLVGIAALVSAITASVLRSHETKQQLVAKQIASSTLESIFSARDVGMPGGIDGWLKVGNVGSGPCSDGVHPANNSSVVNVFYRKIVITDVNDPDRPSPPYGSNPVMIRRVDITIRYPGAGGIREEKVSTIMTNYK